jgi:hypothetical protein
MKGGRRSFCVCRDGGKESNNVKKQAALPVFFSLREHEEIIDRKLENLKRKFAIHIRKHSRSRVAGSELVKNIYS